jgi:hypothetical protein
LENFSALCRLIRPSLFLLSASRNRALYGCAVERFCAGDAGRLNGRSTRAGVFFACIALQHAARVSQLSIVIASARPACWN